MRVWPGSSLPLGASFDGVGTNIALFSDVAEAVELCLFDDEGNEQRIFLPERSGSVWHGYFPDLPANTPYGFRVHGPWDPANGHRCNPAKLLLDPYARAIEGTFEWGQSLFSYGFDDNERLDTSDSAPHSPRSIIVNPFFDWATDQPLGLPWSETVIYEAHVKGATILHPDVDEELRGSYAGIAHTAFVEHLKRLGVTTLEVLPIHEFVHDAHLVERGLRNYWGYNSIGYFAPHHEYSHRHGQGQQVQDFKQMVKTLHQAGIEVILDVVYNHTAEGNHMGPTLSFKGIDNAAYYRLVPEDARYYYDTTGTGNSLNMRNPFVIQLIMDSLRYWVTEMHVDGFRFDLAATLARELHDVDRLSAFFDVIQQDPVVSGVKLIAEPWDVGEGGYQVGNFPALWSEWNGKYRDCMRDFWRGEEQGVAEFAYRLTGSSDLYGDDRRPVASINFITAHDGFTLNDLVSYNDKHNDANGEDNADGESHNRSWNMGAEGDTDDPDIVEARERQKRNFLTTLFVSQGVPMVLGGDEMGRTQHGNNNAYCQDNELSWFDWGQRDENLELLGFTRRLVDFRRAHPVLKRRRWFQGRPLRGADVKDIAWLRLDGEEMTDEDWDVGHAKTLGVFLDGGQIASRGPRGERVVDTCLLLLFSAHFEPIDFVAPDGAYGDAWRVCLDTADPLGEQGDRVYKAGDAVRMVERSIVILERAD